MKDEDKTFTVDLQPKKENKSALRFGQIIGYAIISVISIAIIVGVVALIVLMIRSMF